MRVFVFTKLARVMLLSAVMVAALVGTASAQKGTFTDSRDGKAYKTVKIGAKTWMAQNLDFQTENSWCYDGDASKCKQYGRLYDWNAAKDACPAGWHLPTREEWRQLSKSAGGTGAFANETDKGGSTLKSKSGWAEGGNGSDKLGFGALPGGNRGEDGSFSAVSGMGWWWSATESGGDAYNMSMGCDTDLWYEYKAAKSNGYSVRCVGD